MASPSARRVSVGLETVPEGVASTSSSATASSSSSSSAPFDVVSYYSALLTSDDSLAMPLAAISALSALIAHSTATTATELFALLHAAALLLASRSSNPISSNCGSQLFLRFLTLQKPPESMAFADFKGELVRRCEEFAREGAQRFRNVIARNMLEFVIDGSTIMVHSYSRVVVSSLIYAHSQKKRFSVYVTESRPYGLGIKTHALLTAAGIPTIVILDSSVAWIMAKCDMVIVGSEAVCESGGLVNFIGSYQMAITAKACGKPLYALAESYKFTRLFPLSQYDLPSSLPFAPLAFDSPIPSASSSSNSSITSPLSPTAALSTSSSSSSSKPTISLSTSNKKRAIPPTPSKPMIDSPMPARLEMSMEMILGNPTLDYTTPELIRLIVTDLGAMTPSGVSDALLGIYGGE